nr:MAG: hypothetical protein [Microvirus sp.]
MVLPFLAAIAPFAPLIGGAIGAVGSLLAPKPKAQTQTTTQVVNNSIDLGKLREDAEKNGFNPLTIIRGGGLAGYGSMNTTTTGTIPAAPDTRLSDAMQIFGSGMAQWQYDPYGQQKSQMELRLAEAQIRALDRQGYAPPNMSLDTPRANTSPAGDFDPGIGKGFRFLGWDFKQSGLFSSAERMESDHGDLASSMWGAITIPDAIINTALDWFPKSQAWRNFEREVLGGPKPKVLDITVRGGAN